MKIQAQVVLMLLLILLLPEAVFSQNKVIVKSSILGDDFKSVYILSHTDDNRIFGELYLSSDEIIPEFINVEIPSDSLFHSITILIRKDPSEPEYYHGSVNCYTFWGNSRDTINALSFTGEAPAKKVVNEKLDIKVRINGIGKVDDVYSLSTRSGLKDQMTKLNSKDVELVVSSYSTVGRCVYLMSKKEEEYREVIIHPKNSDLFSDNFSVEYEDLPVHTLRKELDVHTNHRTYVQINANEKNGAVYNLYSSPRTLEKIDGLEIDLPVNLEIADYDVTVISRDLASNSPSYNMTSSTQKIKSIYDMVLPKIVDVSNFVTGNSSGYTVDFQGNKFNSWMLRYAVHGLARNGVHIPWDFYKSNNWYIYGSTNGGILEVFVPELTRDIEEDVFGEHGQLLLDGDSWSFFRKYDDSHRETSSYVKD
ncbi:MAG: hypothetical protein OTI34_16455 [Lewinella sp.]|nr:hypothetical protein [Lewinella sp.]